MRPIRSIFELWDLFSVINVKLYYISDLAPGYLDMMREFRTPNCPPANVLCVPGDGINAVPFIEKTLCDLISQQDRLGSEIKGQEVHCVSSQADFTKILKVVVEGRLK